MRNLFQGGNCNPGTMQANSNQFKQMMENMMIGNQNPQKVIEFMNQGVSIQDQIRNRQMMFSQMNEAWNNQQKKQMMENQMMEQFMRQQQIQYEKQMQMLQQTEWNKAQQHIFRQEQLLNKEFQNVQLHHEAEQWKRRLLNQQNQLLMENQFQQSKISYEQQQARIKNASNNMHELMMQDPQPRFQNSQFLQFLKKINTGELVIHGNELIQKPMSQQDKMKNAFQSSQNQINAKKLNEQKIMNEGYDSCLLQVKNNELLMESAFKKAQQQVTKQNDDVMKMYEQEWKKQLKQYQDQLKPANQVQNNLQKQYENILKEMDFDLSQAWMGAQLSSAQQQKLYGDSRDKYIWTQNNPFNDVINPLNLSFEFIGKGRNNQAILALEAHLKKNQKDSQSWRILGRILQENDQDHKSVPCFVNALRDDPINLDSLLYLGISCTNILDQVKAMNFLRNWMLNNPKYSAIKNQLKFMSDEMVNHGNFKYEQVKQMNLRLIQIFKNGVKLQPKDPELLTSLAVLFFIKREYQTAVQLFGQALNHDPTNYSLWNKMGAALAHLGKPDEAIQCYHRALEIKPIYVRVWVNLGIAHGYKGMYEEAARFYLNALSFRPDAKHIWSYLNTTFMSMQRYDLIKLIERQDPSLFTEFDVMKVQDLPTPQIDYMTSTQQHIIGLQAQRWTKQFL